MFYMTVEEVKSFRNPMFTLVPKRERGLTVGYFAIRTMLSNNGGS